MWVTEQNDSEPQVLWGFLPASSPISPFKALQRPATKGLAHLYVAEFYLPTEPCNFLKKFIV